MTVETFAKVFGEAWYYEHDREQDLGFLTGDDTSKLLRQATCLE